MHRCEVVERGERCAGLAYTTVFDPAQWRQVRRHICAEHFRRAYQRAEMFAFATPAAPRRRPRRAA